MLFLLIETHMTLSPEIDINKPSFVVIAPEDLSKRGGYPMKVYFEADILSTFGQVSLYGYNLQHSDKYKCFDLSTISSYNRGIRKSLKVFLALCRVIIKSKFDYVFLPTVFHPFFPLLFIASKIALSEIIYDFRDPIYGTMITMKDEVYSRTGNRILAWLITKLSILIEAMLIRSSDYILTVSPLLVDYIKRFKKKNHNHIFLYHNYIPSEVKDIQIDQLPPLLQRAINEKVVICYLGHIQTGIRGIEGIFRVLKESSNNDIFLVLMGEIDNRLYWESLIKELGCEKQILIVDPKPKPEALGHLSKFDYAILGPSPSNALPSKIFDTLSVGIKFILPANMTSAIEVLGNYCISYRDYTDLKHLFDGLRKPKKDPNLSQAKDLLRGYSLDSRLRSIFRDIFHRD
jgi:glycosyltransferase involved in cell wall biosynthesis